MVTGLLGADKVTMGDFTVLSQTFCDYPLMTFFIHH